LATGPQVGVLVIFDFRRGRAFPAPAYILGVLQLKTNIVVFPLLMVGMSAWAQAQTAAQAPAKVATVHVQNAILQTKEGQKAAQDLQAKFLPRRTELEKKNADITAIQTQMRAGSATMSDAAKAKLQRDFDNNTKELKRASDDFDAEVQQEEGRLMNDLGQKILEVISKYCGQNSISMVVDVSNQQSPVLWADPSIDITNEVIKLYDQAHPVAGAVPAPSAPPAKKQ
jgi:outer membrane protein